MLRSFIRSLTVFLALVISILGMSSQGNAAPLKRSVLWRSVVVHADDGAAPWERILRDLLMREGRQADWGVGGRPPAIASVEVRALKTDSDGDVARVTCTAVGKLEGGRAVKSTFHFGGSRHDKTKLERRVLQLVARGLVTRLAELSRRTGRTKVNVDKTVGDF